MNEHGPLFDAPAEDGPYQVPGLRAHGHAFNGFWLHIWAEARHPLYNPDDRAAVVQLEGFDPADYEIRAPRVLIKLADGYTRSWWFCRPKATKGTP